MRLITAAIVSCLAAASIATAAEPTLLDAAEAGDRATVRPVAERNEIWWGGFRFVRRGMRPDDARPRTG